MAYHLAKPSDFDTKKGVVYQWNLSSSFMAGVIVLVLVIVMYGAIVPSVFKITGFTDWLLNEIRLVHLIQLSD